MEFIERYPEFAGVSPSRINAAIEDASSRVSKRVWGHLHEQGVHALAAHKLDISGALTKSGHSCGNPMVATSKTAGGLSIGYANKFTGSGVNYGAYGASTYGIEYFELRKLVGVHFLAVP
ncbi:TPA: DUF4054 domain-containing protein [Morganella morganii]|nr:DUF4054 domain-containing protein [Morganella morganii]